MVDKNIPSFEETQVWPKVDLQGVKITSVRVGYKRTWQPADYESLTYDLSLEAAVSDEDNAQDVIGKLCSACKSTVQAWAIPELELVGKKKPLIHRAMAGLGIAPRTTSDTNAELMPTGIPAYLHLAMSELAAQVAGKVRQETLAEANNSKQ